MRDRSQELQGVPSGWVFQGLATDLVSIRTVEEDSPRPELKRLVGLGLSDQDPVRGERALISSIVKISSISVSTRTQDFEARMTGLEPATSGVTGRCSNQLSYIPKRDGAAVASILLDREFPGIPRFPAFLSPIVCQLRKGISLYSPQSGASRVRLGLGPLRMPSCRWLRAPHCLAVRNLSRFLRHALQLLIKQYGSSGYGRRRGQLIEEIPQRGRCSHVQESSGPGGRRLGSAAWRRLTELYQPLIGRWVRPHVAQAADAEDVVQEVLTALVVELPQFAHNQRPGAFRAWLRTITVHRLRSVLGETRWPAAAVTGDPKQCEALAQLADPASALSRAWDEEHDRHITRTLLESIRLEFQPATWRAFQRQVQDGCRPRTSRRNSACQSTPS